MSQELMAKIAQAMQMQNADTGQQMGSLLGGLEEGYEAQGMEAATDLATANPGQEVMLKDHDVAPLERWRQQVQAMVSSPNPSIQKQGQDMMTQYQQRATEQPRKGSAAGQGKMTWEEYKNAPLEEQKLNDRFRNFQPATAIQKADLLGQAKNPAQYKDLLRRLDLNDFRDIGPEFVDFATQGLPSEERSRIKKKIDPSKGQEAVTKSEGDFVANWGSEMTAADNMYDNLTYSLENINQLAGMTGYDTTGFASWLGGIPTSDAKAWNAKKETVLSRLSLDKMLELKAASPTGSTGFGALSEKELMVLQNYLGNLENAQSPRQIKAIIKQIYGQTRKVQKAIRKGQGKSVQRYWELTKDNKYTDSPLEFNQYLGDEYKEDYVPDMLKGGSMEEVPAVNAQGWGIQTDAKGNQAYVGPNGEIEEIF